MNLARPRQIGRLDVCRELFEPLDEPVPFLGRLSSVVRVFPPTVVLAVPLSRPGVTVALALARTVPLPKTVLQRSTQNEGFAPDAELELETVPSPTSTERLSLPFPLPLELPLPLDFEPPSSSSFRFPEETELEVRTYTVEPEALDPEVEEDPELKEDPGGASEKKSSKNESSIDELELFERLELVVVVVLV